jgi:hypothetical protein
MGRIIPNPNILLILVASTFSRSTVDELAKSQKSDGFVKSAKIKARKS